MIRFAGSLGLIALTAGCGSPAPLRPLEGMGPVPTATMAEAPETAEELMTPGTQARPDREAELLIKSQERQDDPFDLPPGDDNGL